MSKNAFWKVVFGHTRQQVRGTGRTEGCRPLRLESLEQRTVLSGGPILVDTFDDVVADDGQTSLREAIHSAAENPGDDRIILPVGRYLLQEGHLEINDPAGKLTIQSVAASLDAQYDSRVLLVSGGSEVELRGLRIVHGQPSVSEYDDGSGGGILNIDSRLSLKRCRVAKNVAVEGGGINNILGAELTLKNSIVGGNLAKAEAFPQGNGGGVNNLNSSVTLVNSIVARNKSIRTGAEDNGGFGGGIMSVGLPPETVPGNWPTVTIVNSAVHHNSANGGGGGIALYTVGITGTLTLKNSTVRHNSAKAESGVGWALGGGIWLNGQFGVNDVHLHNSSICRNAADNEGGGVYIHREVGAVSQVTLKNSLVIGNGSSSDGGGIWNNGVLTLDNSWVKGNTAAVDGGGIFNTEDASLEVYKQSEVDGNLPDNVFFA